MIRLPSQIATASPFNRSWVQTNRSDIFGSLQGSFNLDLITNVGKIRATRILKTTDTTSDSSMTSYPVGFKYFDNYIWTVAGAKAHNNTGNVRVAFSVNSDLNFPSDCSSALSDIEYFAGRLWVTGTGTLTSKAANGSGTGNWNQVSAGLGGFPHMMTVYANRLYISDGGVNIYCVNSSDLTTYVTSSTGTLTFTDTSLIITFLRAASNRIWIGTVNKNNGKAYIHEWDGSATQVTRSYRMESVGALACVIKDDNPWVIDANGKLLVYSSGTFREVARLPIKNTKYLTNPISQSNNRFIHPNGMTLIDGRVNILINNVIDDSGATISEFLPSGVWEYDENVGLYHKYSLSYTPIDTNTITDYGQNRVSAVGGFSEMKNHETGATDNGRLMIGATIYTNASSTTSGVFTNDVLEATTGSNQQTQRACYFVTSKFYSENLQDTWQRLYIRHRQFLSSSNKLSVKYRTTEIDSTEISITWLSTTTFTTATNVVGLEGYEVEVIQGTGSGQVAHITQIDYNGTIYTVTVDDAFTGVTTGTAKARLQNWKKVIPSATDQTLQVHPFTINKVSVWIQFKVYAVLTNKDEIDDFLMANKMFQPIE